MNIRIKDNILKTFIFQVLLALTIALHNSNSEAQLAHHVSPLAPHVSAHPNAAHSFLNPDCAIFSGAFPCAPGDSACETAYKASGCGRRKRDVQYPAHVSPLAPGVSAHPNPAHTSLILPGQSAHPNAAHTFSNPACAKFSGAFPCALGDAACQAEYKASGCGRKKRATLDLAYPGQAHPGQAYPGLAHPGQAHSGQAYPGLAHPGQAFPGFAHPGQAHPGPAFSGNAY